MQTSNFLLVCVCVFSWKKKHYTPIHNFLHRDFPIWNFGCSFSEPLHYSNTYLHPSPLPNPIRFVKAFLLRFLFFFLTILSIWKRFSLLINQIIKLCCFEKAVFLFFLYKELFFCSFGSNLFAFFQVSGDSKWEKKQKKTKN